MAEQNKEQGGFPQNQTGGQDTHSTTGDGHPPRPGEPGYSQEGVAGQDAGQTSGTGGVSGGSGSTGGKQ